MFGNSLTLLGYLSNGFKINMYGTINEILDFVSRRDLHETIDVLRLKGYRRLSGYHVRSNTTRKSKGRVLLSYILDPFFIPESSSLYFRHQNKWEAWAITQAFNELGYDVDLFQYDAVDRRPESYENYDILFGMGPNYERFSSRVDQNTHNIFYGTGRHWKFQNSSEIRRLDRLQKRRSIRLSPKRQISEISHERFTDAILAIGDEGTVQTYKNNTNVQYIESIMNSIPHIKAPISSRGSRVESKSNFLWFGGSGLVHKGLDLVLDAFSPMDECDLYVCGPIDSENEFKNAYHEELFNTDNIHTIGKVNVESKKFREICGKCSFLIFPSASESGYPGSVAVSMRFGVIPVVPPQVANDLGDWGIRLQGTQIDTIRQTCISCSNLPDSEVQNMSDNAIVRSKNIHSQIQFAENFKNTMSKLLQQLNSDG
ncbi:hypothetical protein [Halorarius litoreus]|uniref:hypothetical protein n=1 Tax=Halorarius litoreus TaxID=2962676 RepID=UPI0020CD1819|nr:hypothetical protein [Halorarius litoreus]